MRICIHDHENKKYDLQSFCEQFCCLTLWRAGWVRSHSNTAPDVAACPLALELRDRLLPLQPGPATQRQGQG